MRAEHRKQRQEDGIVEGETRVDEKLIRLFENDVLAPEDFIQVYRTRPFSPERKLMVAVLEEALIDYQRCSNADGNKERERFAKAEAWILETDTEWLFSFVNCCEALGIAPDYLRQGLLRW
ncbi:MAG TPA: hypothetical protein VI585_10585, partial [Candidatus Binatia bacterium]